VLSFAAAWATVCSCTRSGTDFILDSACQAAEQTLLDQRLFVASGDLYQVLLDLGDLLGDAPVHLLGQVEPVVQLVHVAQTAGARPRPRFQHHPKALRASRRRADAAAMSDSAQRAGGLNFWLRRPPR